jgi:apolipoprotein N-acyltransferase
MTSRLGQLGKWTGLGKICLAGIGLALCVPPLPLGPLVPLVLAAILFWLAPKSPGKAAASGFFSGFVFHLASLHWIKNVMSVGPPVTIALGVLLLMAYLSAFHALWAWLWALCLRRDKIWLWPFLFTGIELLRGWGQMSFPWLHLAYDFGDNLPLLQGASVLGVYGTGLLIAATAVLLQQVAARGLDKKWLAIPIGFWGLWVLAGAIRLVAPVGPTRIRVALIQPAIPQTSKWEEAYFQSVMDKTYRTIAKVQGKVDLWVLPETALPDFWTWRPDVAARFMQLADTSNADVVLGALEAIPDPSAPMGARVLNSAFWIRPHKAWIRFDKTRLVPFSEHLPFDNLLPALNKVKLGQSGFSAGDTLSVWNTGIPWSPAICFEQVHADFVRKAAQKGARAMVVVTNDGWFGNSLGPRQHWNIHRFHAVENGMSLARAANTGISGATDSRGVVIARSEMMADTTLVANLPEGSISLYGRFGGILDGLLVLASIAAAIKLLSRYLSFRFRWPVRKPQEDATGRTPGESLN